MGLILFVIFGAIAGWIASIIMRTNASQGLAMNIAVGCVGALLGGAVFNTIGAAGITGFNLWSLLVAIAGSVMLLWMVNALRRATRRSS